MTVDPSRTPTSASLRKLLIRVLTSDADLDAFCLDYFPSVHERFSDGMERTRKLNLLLEHAQKTTILAKLAEARPVSLSRYNEELFYTENPTPAYRNEQVRTLGEELQRLYEQKEVQFLIGEDSTETDKSIIDARRRLRQGPQYQAGEFIQESRFRLIEIIGKGGFATVWLAYDRVARQQVAVKVLHSQWSDDTQRVERFYRGARRMAQLNHPGIVRVLHEPREEDGFHYFIMEYVPGGDLRRAVQDNRLPPTEGIEIIRQVGNALSFAHSRGVVHRDVKPANILLSPHGPRLTDFDLAWAVETTGGTNTGALGTFLYAAPEMMQNAQDVTPAADVYSLAMTTVFVLYGGEPVDMVGERLGFLKQLIHAKTLFDVLCKATERLLEARFTSISSFCDALANPDLLANTREETPPTTLRKSSTSRPENMIGMTIGGYRLVSLLGSGSTGSVYKAENLLIGKYAAIKLLSRVIQMKSHARARFLYTLKRISHVKHPGLVEIFDLGELSDGSPYITMEYFDGQTLQDIFLNSGKMPWREVSIIGRHIAECMNVVHQAGVVHLDLRPSKIMLKHESGNLFIKISDLGLSRASGLVITDLDDNEGGDGRFNVSTIGSPGYMSPEQIRNDKIIQGQSDVYSLGVMLMEVILGRNFFAADSLGFMLATHMNDSPPPLRDLDASVPKPLSALVERMLSKKADNRPTMAQVADALTKIGRS